VLLLAFDTATPAVTVALHDGSGVLAQETTVDARRHGELLASSIASVLAAAGATREDLTGVAVGTGPGPYTGLRVGLVTAQVLGSALGIPAHGVCTLDVIASDAALAGPGREFVVATDARRRELYWARYDADALRLSGPAVNAPADIASQIGTGIPVAGTGALLHAGLLAEPIAPEYPAAGTLARLGVQWLAAGNPALPPEPIYLRRPDARVPGVPKRVSVP
jgi:tRNA threonylcarbamoyl adenosine modification protein YeaZ